MVSIRFFRIALALALSVLFFVPHTSAASDPLSDVTFFGDSTTAHLAVRGGIPWDRVWSGVAETVLFETVNDIRCVHLRGENCDLTLREAVARKHPRILVVTVGVSGGAGHLPKERFQQIYRDLIRSVRCASDGTRLIVQSVLPLSDRSVKHYKRLTKEAVCLANAWIREVCREMDVPFIDTHAVLVDPATGYLKNEYQNDEYMHLTASAYAAMLAHLRSALVALGY